VTDGHLLRRFLNKRSEESFAELVRRHAGMVQDVAARRLGDAALAEDVAQAVFLTLLRRAKSLGREGSLAGWLFRTTELVCRDALRERRSRARREKEAGMKRAEERTGPAGTEALEVDPAVAELPARYRDALTLRYYQGLSVAETAQRLGCPARTVETRLARGLQRLRKRLSRREPVSAAALATLLAERSASPAAATLITSIREVCLGTAAPSATVVVMMEALMKATLFAKIKFASAALAAAGLLVAAWPAVRFLTAAEPAPKTVKPRPKRPRAKKSPPKAVKVTKEDWACQGMIKKLLGTTRVAKAKSQFDAFKKAVDESNRIGLAHGKSSQKFKDAAAAMNAAYDAYLAALIRQFTSEEATRYAAAKALQKKHQLEYKDFMASHRAQLLAEKRGLMAGKEPAADGALLTAQAMQKRHAQAMEDILKRKSAPPAKKPTEDKF
jgi:RNA polymerase sigma factor (sigma-70 family)